MKGVPTLILSGDLDTIVPTAITRQLLRVFPDATCSQSREPRIRPPAGALCADAVHEFVRTLDLASSCDEPAFVRRRPRRSPSAAQAAAAASTPTGDESTGLDRKVVTAAVQRFVTRGCEVSGSPVRSGT